MTNAFVAHANSIQQVCHPAERELYMCKVALLYEYLWKLKLICLWFTRLNYIVCLQGNLNSFVRFFVLIYLDGKETAVENSHRYFCNLDR